MAEITLLVALLAGMGSFVAPCILPMIPAFLAYISGTTLSDLGRTTATGVTQASTKRKVSNKDVDNLIEKDRVIVATQTSVQINRTGIIFNTVFFVVGFSVVFSTLGVLLNSVLSSSAGQWVESLNQIGGIIIVGFGVFLLLSTKIRGLNIEKKFFPKGKGSSYPMSFVFGLAFAVGWTPCVGPILGTILTLAATTPSIAFNMLLAYSLGLGIPFILMGVFYSRATRLIRSMSKHLKYYNVVLGGFIILLGVLVFTNQLAQIANFPLLNELLFLG